MSLQISVRSIRERFAWIFLIASITGVLLLALWLRWQYATQVQLHVDEFTSLWAAQQVQEKGAPIMPSGVLYTRGILSSYLIAFAQSMAGNAPIVGRSVSIFFGVAAVVAIFFAGRREWTTRVGWVAAVGLTLLPEAIVWSGRARFYSPLVFFSLLTVWVAFAIIQLPASSTTSTTRAQWRLSMLFTLLFVLSIFSQEQTIFLYPSILIAFVVWRGWRFLLHPPIAVAQLICIGAMALRFVIEQIGQPGYFEAIQTHQSYIQLIDNLAGAWRVYSHALLSTRRLPWSVLMAVALFAALFAVWSTARSSNDGKGLLDRLPRYHQATLFFGWQFLFVLTLLFTVVGGSWTDSRYLLLIEPYWMLLGGAGLIWLIDQFMYSNLWRWIATIGLTAALAWWMWPITVKATIQEAGGYQEAMAYVAARRQPEDIVMSQQASACAWSMGFPCNYYVTQEGWQPFVVQRENRLVDRWSGAELLNTTSQLRDILQSNSTVWYIIDSKRFARLFEADFLEMIFQQFDRVFEVEGVSVLFSEGWKEPTTVVATDHYEPPISMGELALLGWKRREITSEGRLPVTFFWQSSAEIRTQINTSMQVFAANGAPIAQDDGPPARGMISTSDFTSNPVPDLKAPLLPDVLAPGRYRIDVAAYRSDSHELLSEPAAVDWLWLGPPPEPPTVVLNKRWEGSIFLIGHDDIPTELQPATQIELRLIWSAVQRPNTEYTVFVQLLDRDNNIIAQDDRAPENGFYPTNQWDAGDAVTDLHLLVLPNDVPEGPIRLIVGLYDPMTGQRLRLLSGEDAMQIAEW
jgi:hypothetical protein